MREARRLAALQTPAAMQARVSRVVVYPGDVSLQAGREVQPLAAAVDSQGNSLPGVPLNWSVTNPQGRAGAVDETGRFAGVTAGTYVLKVSDAAGHAATMKVSVLPEPSTTLPSASAVVALPSARP